MMTEYTITADTIEAAHLASEIIDAAMMALIRGRGFARTCPVTYQLADGQPLLCIDTGHILPDQIWRIRRQLLRRTRGAATISSTSSAGAQPLEGLEADGLPPIKSLAELMTLYRSREGAQA